MYLIIVQILFYTYCKTIMKNCTAYKMFILWKLFKLIFTVLKLISEFLNEFFHLAIGITFILLPRIESAKTVFMFRYNNIITQLFKCAEFTLVKMCWVFFARRQLHFLLGFLVWSSYCHNSSPWSLPNQLSSA